MNSNLGIEWNGYFDFYFQSSPQGHAAVPATSAGPTVLEGRYFDKHINQMTLNMAEISFKKKSGKVSYRADFAIGEMVDQLSGGGSQSVTGTGSRQNPTNTAANEPTRNLTQAILTYAATDRFSLSAGKFYIPTWVGRSPKQKTIGSTREAILSTMQSHFGMKVLVAPTR